MRMITLLFLTVYSVFGWAQYSEDFEGSVLGWEADGLWHLSDGEGCAVAPYGSQAFRYGRTGICDYNDNTTYYNSGTLMSPTISGITSQTVLSFEHFADTEAHPLLPADQKRLEIIDAYGNSETLWNSFGLTTAWETVQVDLSFYAGQSIRLRFVFDTYDRWLNLTSGWWIDNVVVSPANDGAAIHITSHGHEEQVLAGTPVAFTASAIDALDGDISQNIQWFDGTNTFLGSGATLAATFNNEHLQKIIARVTNSQNQTTESLLWVDARYPISIEILSPLGVQSIAEQEVLLISAQATHPVHGDVSNQIDWQIPDSTLFNRATYNFLSYYAGEFTVIAMIDNGDFKYQDSILVRVRPDGGSEVAIEQPYSSGSWQETMSDHSSRPFVARAIDASGVDLGATLVWTSDLDGYVGTGSTIPGSLTSIGVHTITASFTDLNQNLISATTTVEVLANTPPQLTYFNWAGDVIADGEYFTADAGNSIDGEDSYIAVLHWSSDRDGVLEENNYDIMPGARLSLGEHVITLEGTDFSGASSSVSFNITVVDDTRPTVNVTAPTEGGSYPVGTPVTLEAVATDAEDGDISSQIEWYDDYGNLLGSGASLTKSFSQGYQYITAVVFDSVGLKGDDFFYFRMTNSAPQLSVNGPSAGSSYEAGATVNFMASASDAEAGDLSSSIVWTSDIDGPFGTGGNLLFNSLSAANHFITASVDDGFGGTDSVSFPLQILFNEAPVVAIQAPLNGSSVVEDALVSFSGSANDSALGVVSDRLQWTSDLDGNLGSGAGFSLVLSVGTHLITAAATDDGGLTGQATVSVTVNPNQVPVVTILTPSDQGSAQIDSSISLSASATDAEDGDLSGAISWSSDLDGALGSGASIVKVLSVGTHMLTATVSDSHGAQISASLSFTVNPNQPPVIAITAPSDGSNVVTGSAVSFAANATDLEDGDLSAAIVWTSNRDGQLAIGANFTTPSLSAGPHTITASVIDSHGSQVVDQIAINLNSLPVVAIQSPGDASVLPVGMSINFSGTASDAEDGDLAATIAWVSSLDGALGSGASLNVAALSRGQHMISAQVSDSGGLMAQASISLIVNGLPSVVITSPSDGTATTSDQIVNFSGNANDLEDGDLSAGLTWVSDLDGVLGNGASIGTTLSVGTHFITAMASDSYGFDGSDQIIITVAAPWVVYSQDDFESGLGVWSTGGKDAALMGSQYAHSGSNAVRLRDNSGAASAMTTTLNLSGKTDMVLDFWMQAVGMNTGESLLVEYHDGSGWQVLANLVAGTDFTNNSFVNPTVAIDAFSHNLVNGAQLRLRCDASHKNDQVYIDDVTITLR